MSCHRLLVPWEQSRWLMASSMCMMVPAYYAFHKEMRYHSGIMAMASLASVNYWRCATVGCRRVVDITLAQAAFWLFFYTGVKCIRTRTWKSWILPSLSVYFFCRATESHCQGHPKWHFYHILFHMLGSAQACWVLHCTHESWKKS